MNKGDKLFILGLDCLAPELVFGESAKDLKNISGILDKSIYGELKSTCPPITVPAWMSMFTGRDPGELGFYGFKDRRSFGYGDSYLLNSAAVKEPVLWEYFAQKGMKSVVIGVPQTYPPKPFGGVLVCSFLTPDTDLEYTHPPYIKEEINRITGGKYMIDVDNFRTQDKDALLDQIYSMTENRFKVISDFIGSKDWNLFIAVEMGVDRIHHGFWGKDGQNDRIKGYYRYIDEQIGKLLEKLDDRTGLMIVSDHGARSNRGTFNINNWLIENGYLVLRGRPAEQGRLDPNTVDWKKTRAWAEGGYYGKIFLNVKGREPVGKIKKKEIAKFKERLACELETAGAGEAELKNRCFFPEQIYRRVNGIPPDIIVYSRDLSFRVSGCTGGGLFVKGAADLSDSANHSEHGVYIDYLPGRTSGNGYKEGLSIYDVVPTVLERFKMEAGSGFRGRVIP
ncbi:MAG: alkaline phosphatase family protein [Elusimicrobia bacterium]|nr:alkaline phosphatase family protein [Elusimicrobiota bacterium]